LRSCLPYSTLIAVSFSKSWGLDFWKGLTLQNYKFILFEYNVTQRAILNSLGLATVAADHRGAARRDHRLD
jgi:iron(III) transport system permease protein